jgi:hypothetical protein
VPGGRSPIEGGVVTSVVLPCVQQTDDGWHVSAAELCLTARHLRPYGLARLAQVYALARPPGARSLSRRPGTLSISLPPHALACHGLGEAEVHVPEPPGWRGLGPDELDDWICVVPSTIDRRAGQES